MRIGVVIPMHAYPQHREACLRSVFGVQPHLIVCVFNGVSGPEYRLSMDRLASMSLMRGSRIPIKFLELEEGNVSSARNAGFQLLASQECDWVIPLDEDDLLNPQYISRMEVAQKALPDRGILYPDWTKFSGWQGYGQHREYSLEALQREGFIISSSLISVEAWQKVKDFNGMGYDENLVRKGMRWEDWLFYLTAGGLGVKMARVGYPLVRVRGNGQGTKIAHSTRGRWIKYANRVLKPLGVSVG